MLNTLLLAWKMRYEQPVFIVGPARSGTTLLYRTLLKHPAFTVHARDASFALAESMVFTRPENLYSADPDPTERARAYCLHDQQALHAFYKHLPRIQRYRAYFQSCRGDNGTFRQHLHHWLLRCYFHYAKQARRTNRLLEKTPNHIHHINDILSTFPKAKIIFIYRHPVDVFSSYRKRLKREQELGTPVEQMQWLTISPAEFCEHYRYSIENGLNWLRQKPDSIFAVKYETLVQEPEDTLNHLLHNLTLPADAKTLLAADVSQTHNTIDENANKAITATTKNWSDHLCNEDAQQIEQTLQALMNTLDYSRYSL